MITVQNIYKTMMFYGYIIVSQSSLRWDIKKTTVVYGQNATLSCNGNGCMPISIRKWIGGPTDDVLCFDEYSSNPAKYQLMYNKSKPSFDLMIKRFNFTDANCSYTCACGFFKYTNMLQMQQIDFVYPPDKDIISETKQEDGKLYIHLSMKVHPFPNCSIIYENTVLPVKLKSIDVQEELGIKLYLLKLEYILDLEFKNCRQNITVSCEVKSIKFPLLQEELVLCKDHPDASNYSVLWILLGLLCCFSVVLMMVICEWRRRQRGKTRKRQKTRNRQSSENSESLTCSNEPYDESPNFEFEEINHCDSTWPDNNENTSWRIMSTVE